MSRLYACIISAEAKRDREALASIARKFSYSIEVLDDGILFDVSGLEKLIGKSERVAQKIYDELSGRGLPGSLAVAETVDTAVLLARQDSGGEQTLHSPDTFEQLTLNELPIEPDTLNVFRELGIRKIEDLLAIPTGDLVGRYGRDFEDVMDIIRQKGASLLTPNIKEDQVAWAYELDVAVEDFEQLIFILNHGLDDLLGQVDHYGFSAEHLDIAFTLSNKTKKEYEIKTSFPTLDKTFWLKLINLRVSLNPPEAGIMSVRVIAYFTRPRPAQRALYAASRPEPENLLLTANKLKKLVGEENVGVPILLDQRLAEAFELDADALPQGNEKLEAVHGKPVIAFSYFHPPLRAEVLVRDGRLTYIGTQYFSGHVLEYSGVWKANSKWWDRSWKTQEWDVEIENKGVYRLCKVDKDWFLAGEYD